MTELEQRTVVNGALGAHDGHRSPSGAGFVVNCDHAQVTVLNLGGDATGIALSGGTAIGSQSVNGAGSAAGGQVVLGDGNTVAGKEVIAVREEPSVRDTWWTRLRKRGFFVAAFTILGGIAGVVAAVVAVIALVEQC
jgi:hypothetical protein